MLIAAIPTVSLMPAATAAPPTVLFKDMPLGSFGVIRTPGSFQGQVVYRSDLDRVVSLSAARVSWSDLTTLPLCVETVKKGEKVVIEIA